MTLKERLIKRIDREGPLTVADYMAACLYDPEAGYYTTRQPFGPRGDFTTAPELTPLFGEMLGLWVANLWQQMGQPETFNLIEPGPGRGIMAADMLRALKKAAPDCLRACQLHLVEVSPQLKQIQQKTLKDAGFNATWHSEISTTPAQNAIAVSNELMDALPVRQYQKTQNGLYHERLVGHQKGDFTFILAEKPSQPPLQAETGIIEHSPALDHMLETLRAHLPDSVLLLIDYGAQHPSPGADGDTLQALQNHRHVDIFAAPGKADITWHIPFGHVFDILDSKACALTDMSLFLTELGLPVRAEQAMRTARDDAARAHIAQTAGRLLDPNQMGRHFKVLCRCGREGIAPAGFTHLQQVHNQEKTQNGTY